MYIGENFIGEGEGILLDANVSEIVLKNSYFRESLSFTSSMDVSATSNMIIPTFESDLL